MNASRVYRWHDGRDGWTGADWSNAMCGEAGEAANVVKKLRRAELGTRNQDSPVPLLMHDLGYEIADTIIYADLLAAYYGINTGRVVAEKFNLVSIKFGFPERLSE